MEELGRNPGRIIGAWRDFVRDHAGGDAPPLGIGEPIWPERTEAELVECQRHETLLNLAFAAETPGRCCAPTTPSGSPPRSSRARAATTRTSSSTARPAAARPTCARSRPRAAARAGRETAELRFAHGDLANVREFLASARSAAGIEGRRLADLVLAVDELATNSLRYARGEGTVRTWRENGSLLVEVADDGHIADPLAGRDSRPRRDRRPRPVPGQPALRPRAAALLARGQRDPHPHAPGLTGTHVVGASTCSPSSRRVPDRRSGRPG